MWKRRNNVKRASQPPISSPLASNLHEKAHLERSGNHQNVIQSRGPPPPRPPRDDLQEGLPQYSQSGPPPGPPPTHRLPDPRPRSSILSQPSPNAPIDQHPGTSYLHRSTTYDEEVSPPSSPEHGAYLKRRSRVPNSDDQVSPLDDMPDMSRLGLGKGKGKPDSSSKPPSSSIPILRRENKQAAIAAANSQREGKGRPTTDMKWDPYSGELTTSERGKPQSVKPKQYTPPGHPTHSLTGKPLGNHSMVTASTHNEPSFGDRIRKLKVKTAPAEKPEWKGSSGRHKLVSPVADRSDIPPLSIPRKSSERSNSGSNTPVLATQRGGETGHPLMHEFVDPGIRAVPTEDGQSSPYSNFGKSQSPEPSSALWAQRKPLADDSKTQARGDYSPVEVPNAYSQQREDSTGTIERNFHEALKDVNFPAVDPNEPYVQPSSRFNLTTYAPSDAHSSPRLSMDELKKQNPTPPQHQHEFVLPSPILNRKRPKIGPGSPGIGPKSTTRKAVPASNSPIFINMKSSIASDELSPTPTSSMPPPSFMPNPELRRVSNVSKSLPQSPAEASSHDLITSLQAQLENLEQRRNNISRSIRQMTELMPMDHVVLTEEISAKREMEKRKVEGLREEEMDIKRQEHELGLSLHRAWKRRDKDAIYEPTGLWVRRVTE